MTFAQREKLRTVFAAYRGHRLAKYFDIDYQETAAEERYRLYGLSDRSVTPKQLSILDIGGGLGYFAAACNSLGHRAILMDLPEPLIGATAAVLDLHYIAKPLRDDEPVIAAHGLFDLVTMHRVNVEQDGNGWTRENYERFGELLWPHLNPGGRWIIDPNDGLRAMLMDWWAWDKWLAGRGTAHFPVSKPIHTEAIGSTGQIVVLTKGA